MRQIRTYDDWIVLVKKFHESGLSLTPWCKNNNISKSTIYPYIKAYRNNIADKTTEWVKVDLPKQNITETPILLKIGAVIIEVTKNFDKPTLSEVIKMVASLC